MKITRKFYYQQPQFIACIDWLTGSKLEYSHYKFNTLSDALAYIDDLTSSNEDIYACYVYEKSFISNDKNSIIYKRALRVNKGITTDCEGQFLIVLKDERFLTGLYHSFMGTETYFEQF